MPDSATRLSRSATAPYASGASLLAVMRCFTFPSVSDIPRDRLPGTPLLCPKKDWEPSRRASSSDSLRARLPRALEEPQHLCCVRIEHLRPHELPVAQLVDSHHRHVERFIPIGGSRSQPPTGDHVIARVDEGRLQLPLVSGLQGRPGPHPARGVQSHALQAVEFAAVRERTRFAYHNLRMARRGVGFQVAFFDAPEEPSDGLGSLATSLLLYFFRFLSVRRPPSSRLRRGIFRRG